MLDAQGQNEAERQGGGGTELLERRQGARMGSAGAGGQRPTAKNAMMLGGAALAVCIVSFIGQTTVTRRVQESYVKPYFILWISHSFWIIMVPLHAAYEKLKRSPRSLAELRNEALVASAKLIVQRRDRRTGDQYRAVQTADTDDADDDDDDHDVRHARASGVGHGADLVHVRATARKNTEDEPAADGGSDGDDGPESDDGSHALAQQQAWWVFWRMCALAAGLVALLNASAYLWYVAVGLSSMSKVTAIYNMSCFFAYLFSILLLRDRVQVAKCVAVAISIVGVVLMALVNSGADAQTADSRKSELIGDALSLVCACGIGLYQVLYKKLAVPQGYHSLFAVNFITTLLGLSTLVLCWAPLPILHLAHIERFQLPSRAELGLICANALLGVAYNAGFMIALALTSPLFAAVGVMLTIPAMAVVDMLAQHEILAWNVLAGAAAILAGFCILTFAEYRDTMRKSRSADADRQVAP
ncbi:hypothetical protein GGF46_002627 [Coemansia sp. RSA 552]|nr:hypothetical protein GGF46_002627 [Coemansia sp. RSA 552]